ncbi:MAG: type IV-A pilus assembly ATPase PilB, partial [Methylococcales bacterium]|nr:type IV-A pilus assembly ATPase PilB [Methylococcales bacterium]
MATVHTDLQFGGLAKCLVQDGVLTETDAKTHVEDAQKKKTPLISYLVSNKIVASTTIASLASIEFGVPFFDLDAID